MADAARDGSVVVVEMRREALAEVMEIERECFSDPWSERAFHQTLRAPRTVALAAIDPESGTTIGYVVGWFVMDEGEIANVAVREGWRGRGIGGVLLDEAMARAASRGVRTLYLEVRESNVAALRLYSSRGFEQVGRRAGYYRTPKEDALVLKRRIGEVAATGS